MPSHLHELLVDMFHRHPGLAASLLRGPSPRKRRGRLWKADLTALEATSLRADAVILLSNPRVAVIVEVQLRRDRKKRRAWPFYVAALHHELGIPVILLVLTLDEGVATWAAEVMEMGPGSQVRAVVIGPSAIPFEAPPGDPEAAVLAVLAHGAGPRAREVALHALTAVSTLDEERARRYTALILRTVEQRHRAWLEEIMLQHEPQSRFLNTLERRAARRGRKEGEKEGRHEATRELVVRQLTLRFGELPEAARAAIAAAPTHRLDAMVERVLTASTLDQVLG